MNVSKLIPSQRENLNTLDKKQSGATRKMAFVIFTIVFLFSLVDLVSAQTRSTRWIYTSTWGENIKQYYRGGIKKISVNRRRGGVKMILPDRRFVIASRIWDSKLSLSKTTSITTYDDLGIVIGKSKGLDWQIDHPIVNK